MSRVGTSSWKSAGQKGPPVGQAPRLRHRYRHDRVSVISALTVAPRRHRFGLYFDLHLRNITGAEVITFLRYLLRHLRGSVVLLWDGERSIDITTSNYFSSGIPAWRSIASPATRPNSIPTNSSGPRRNVIWHTDHDGVVPLTLHVVRSLRRIGQSQVLLRSCVHASELPWPGRARRGIASATAKAGGVRNMLVLDHARLLRPQRGRGTRVAVLTIEQSAVSRAIAVRLLHHPPGAIVGARPSGRSRPLAAGDPSVMRPGMQVASIAGGYFRLARFIAHSALWRSRFV